MKQKMSEAMITVMGVALIVYTSMRTLNFIRLTLPAGAQDTGYLALVAFDGGVLLWLWFYLHGARGPWQRGISALMVVVDLLGVIVGFGADTVWTASGYGLAKMSAESAQTAIYAMVGIIALNIIAVVVTHLTSPAALLAQSHEEANDMIVTATLEQIKANAVNLASEVAPQVAADWQQRTRRQHLDPLEVDGHAVPVKRVAAPAPQLAPERLNAQPEPETEPAGVTVKRASRPNP